MQERAKPNNLIEGATGEWEVVIGMEVHAQVTSNAKLFSGDLDALRDQLFVLSLSWLLGNGIRLGLVGASLYYLLRAYVLVQAQPTSSRC